VIPEAPLRQSKNGLVADEAGWFVVNARESRVASLTRIVWLVVASVLLAAVSGCSADGEDAGVPPAEPANQPVLSAGEERRFAPGKLSAGDTITCVAGGLTIEVRVPKPRQRGLVSKSTNAWKKDGSRASVKATVWSNRRVVATCS
jgi:hypothetical protein